MRELPAVSLCESFKHNLEGDEAVEHREHSQAENDERVVDDEIIEDPVLGFGTYVDQIANHVRTIRIE